MSHPSLPVRLEKPRAMYCNRFFHVADVFDTDSCALVALKLVVMVRNVASSMDHDPFSG